MIRKFIIANQKLSKLVDKALPEKFRKAGGEDFVKYIIPQFLSKDIVIYDVGGGKRPYLSVNQKEELNVKVVGIDISESEIKSAPKGSYDHSIVSPIEDVYGCSDGDLVICNAVLEHVSDVEKAVISIHSLIKKNGVALLFIPGKNAIYARLNRFLPERLKNQILFRIFPKKESFSGFPAYYCQCTPNAIKKIASSAGFTVLSEKHYYWSSYFSFLLPLYVIWRFFFFSLYAVIGSEACEGFTLCLKKQ